MADLTFAAMVCKPSCTNELKESIIKSFGNAHRFYMKNRGKLLHKMDEQIPDYFLEFSGRDWDGNPLLEIEGETPKAILEDFLRPYYMGTVFERNREHYRNVLMRFNSYYHKLHEGTINHLGGTEEDRAYNRLFNQFRGTLVYLVPLTAESIDLWYERTELWKWQYSLIFPELTSERRV